MPALKNITTALSALHTRFAPNELAYLALTQKVEHAIRDKLAFELHNNIQASPPWTPSPSGFLVCREWQRTDLAVIENDLQVNIIEATAIYTFDLFKSGVLPANYKSKLAKYIAKAKAISKLPSHPDKAVYTLLLATHMEKSIPPTVRQ